MLNFPNSLVTSESIVPAVGMVATICNYSDRYPAEVVRVSKSGKTFWIRYVTSKIVSGSERDGSAVYTYCSQVNETYEIRVNLTANGWIRQGSKANIWLGRQERYCDPSF